MPATTDNTTPLPVFRNHYHCDACGDTWTDEWTCRSASDCRTCDARDVPAMASEAIETTATTGGPELIAHRPRIYDPEQGELAQLGPPLAIEPLSHALDVNLAHPSDPHTAHPVEWSGARVFVERLPQAWRVYLHAFNEGPVLRLVIPDDVEARCELLYHPARADAEAGAL